MSFYGMFHNTSQAEHHNTISISLNSMSSTDEMGNTEKNNTLFFSYLQLQVQELIK